MPAHVRIGVALYHHLGYSRGVLLGVRRYALTRPDWLLVPVELDGLTAGVLRAARPDGLVAGVDGRAVARLVGRAGRPAVNVVAVAPQVSLPAVGVDHAEVGRLAAGHLLDRGFRRFGFVGHPTHLYSLRREAGFRASVAPVRVARFVERPARSYRTRGRLLAVDPRLGRWLAGLPKPAGVFACHDVWAFQVVEACRLAGLRVPEDVAVVGVDNDDLLCELARPSLSSVRVPAERVGYEAAALLDRLLAGAVPRTGPVLVPPPGVMARQSTDVLALDDPDVVAALRYVRCHAYGQFRVADVLRQVPVSRRALEQRFRAAVGRGMAAEVRRLRVARAKELLATTDLPVAEVGKAVGYGCPYLFAHTFHREAGVSPTVHRRQVGRATGC